MRSPRVKIFSFDEVPKERIEDLYSTITQKIVNSEVLNTPSLPDAKFYQTFFKKAWDDAVKQASISDS